MPCQQDSVYTAERGIDEGPVFESLHHTQVFVDELRETWWWTQWITNIRRVEVGPAIPGSKWAGVGGYWPEKECGRLEFTTSRPTLMLVVHELAHVVAKARRHSGSHDPWFARIYLELVYLIMGPSTYAELMMNFMLNGVDFDAGGITDWTPESPR